MNNFRLVAQNTFFLTISEFFLKILGFFWVIYLARALSVELFGRYNFVNSFISLFSFLPDLGVGLIVIREIARNRKKTPEYLGNSFILNGFFALITFVLILVFAKLLNFENKIIWLILIASLTLFFSTLRSVGIFYFDGTEKMSFSAFLNFLNSFLLILFGLVAFVLGYGLSGIFWGMFLGTLLSLLITWFTVGRFVAPKFSINLKIIKNLFFQGLPLGLAGLAAMIYMKIDSVLLAFFLSERSVGIYSAAIPFVFSLIQLLNVPFVVAVYPALSRLFSTDKTRFAKALKKSLFVVAFWSFPAAFLLSLLSGVLIPLFFGDRYALAIPVLRILIFFVPFASLSALLYKALIILNKQAVYLYISLLGALVNIIFNFLLIPILFEKGAAFSSVFTQFIIFVLYGFFVSKYIGNLKSTK